MFIARTIFHPAAGCLPELRTALAGLLEGHVAASLAVRSTLTQRLWGSLPELRISRWYNSLADYEAAFHAQQPNPPVAAQFKSILAVAPGSDIDEVLVPAPDGPDPAYIVRFEYHPAQGKVQDLRDRWAPTSPGRPTRRTSTACSPASARRSVRPSRHAPLAEPAY